MKKNTISSILLTIAIFALHSCDNNNLGESNPLPEVGSLIDLTPQEYASIAFDNPRELTEEEAINVAKTFIESKNAVEVKKKGTKSSNESVLLDIKTKYYFGKNTQDGVLTKSSAKEDVGINVPIYELSITNGGETGLVIVSGDERAQKVIAYIPKVNKKSEKSPSGSEYFEELAKINLLDNIVQIENLKDSLKMITLEKIARERGVDSKDIRFSDIKKYLSVNNEPLSKAKPVQTPPSQVLSYVLPMCIAQWDQEAPYNNNMPIGMVEKYFEGHFEEGHYMAGCGVVALAQIMAAVQPSITAYGTTINWSYLLQNAKIEEPDYFNPGDPAEKRDMVAKLFREIYDQSGSFPTKNSQGYITAVATYDTSCETYIKRYANCSNRQKWNSDVVRNSILALRPVLATGEGTKPSGAISKHAFIIDGYLLCKQFYGAMAASIDTGSKELVKIYDLYFHANFGWNGASDGYYLINKDISVDFETLNATYRTGNLNIIPNIVKK